MKTTRTDLLHPDTLKTETEKLWIYNGLDCCVTLEVLEELLPQLDNVTGRNLCPVTGASGARP